MKLKLSITALILGLAVPAAAEFTTIQQAYEVALSELRLPQSETGTIAFKPCENCDFRTKRVDGNTRWVINGHQVTLQKFGEAVGRVLDRDEESVTVLHHLEKDRITEVAVHL